MKKCSLCLTGKGFTEAFLKIGKCCVFFFLSVDADEIKRLGKRFKKLDLDNSGSLSVEEFMSLPELQQNPLVQRVIDIFDTDGNGEVDFKGKTQCLVTGGGILLEFLEPWNSNFASTEKGRVKKTC